MKTGKFYLAAALVLIFAGNIYSQNGWGPGSSYNRMYDTKTVETISGSVISIDQILPDKNMSVGIHLLLNTVNGNVSIHLGPAWYIENQDIQIIKGDNVSVTGSKVTYNGDQVIIAKEVIKGDQLLKLRDENGYPLWSGWRNK
ncbi:MAG: DNA-binding protein [Ignavibacteria bacterium]|nr:DNA-binding protein [Ignavibacteria bacterium]MBK7253509.1 DNA-binding protein [Ignavibacteria bacterium]MBK7445802.1 DNA-binding protein [Ignavibacteria bacterium]MBK9404364.1 DNA-binding protein [Ignavibacteria bacterium]MBL0109035.1 DNA-binding protein [Ignavibacteria bacterium]